jgi:hypothetical protein
MLAALFTSKEAEDCILISNPILLNQNYLFVALITVPTPALIKNGLSSCIGRSKLCKKVPVLLLSISIFP